MLKFCIALLPILQLIRGLPVTEEGSELTLDVIHINDIHSYFEETDSYSARCREPTEQCYGGVARVFTKAKEIKDRAPDTTIFLNAGDFYQGTVWYSKFKFEPMVEFGNLLNYTAMGLGNHDFDDQIPGLVPFAELVSFPLLAANIENTGSTDLVEGVHYQKSVVKEINGTKVGIIGYITRSTSYNFPDGSITFTDEVDSVGAEAERLNADGVKVLIALGHSGYDIDQELARNIPLLDLVVGGHSHTFLYPEDIADEAVDYVRGPYPTYISPEVDTTKEIPVVQAKCYTKYLGHLTLNFDAEGELKKPMKGGGVSFALPYLLDGSVEPDQNTLDMMKFWQDQLGEYKSVVGVSLDTLLDGQTDSSESKLGNALADSMLDVYEDTTMALLNNGGIRNAIPEGNITGEDIYYVLPFENTVDKISIRGRELKKALELAANSMDPNDWYHYPGFGLQVAGMRLEIDIETGNEGNRITKFEAKNQEGGLELIDPDMIYKVAIGSFLAPAGRQSYLRGIFDAVEILEHVPGNVTDYTAMKEWIIRNSPIDPQYEHRINTYFHPDNDEL